jgi:hypothetical protein
MVTNEQKSFLVQKVASRLGVPIILDANHCAKAGGYACIETDELGVIKVYVSDVSDVHSIAHELVHVLQVCKNKYYFKLPELEEYLLNIGLTPDEEFLQQTFLPHWRKVTSQGYYAHSEFSSELPAYYVEYANNGWQLFQHFCGDAKLF